MIDHDQARCAVVQIADGAVINIIISAPGDPAPDGCQLIALAASQPCNIGWTWNGFMFVDPFPPSPDIEG